MAESYHVQLAPLAERQRGNLSATYLLELERILMFLSVRPHPQAGSQVISTRTVDELLFFRFAQQGIPFAVEYRVYEPETGTVGLVVVTQLAELDD